jgi:hypothetical protein
MRFLSVLGVWSTRVSFVNLLSGIARRSRARQVKTSRPCRPRLETLEDRTLLSVFTVDHLADDLVGSGLNGSLRYAITNAGDNDTINFNVTGTINLTGPLPDLTHNISIQGPGPDELTVRRGNGDAQYRIFTLLTTTTISIAGLTIANGFFQSNYFGFGAGILNPGMLTVSNCTISGNSSFGDPYVGPSYGGGIYNTGTLTLHNSTVSGNFTSYGGGAGIYNIGTLTLNNSTVSGNFSRDGDTPGGIENVGTLTLNTCTVSGNLGGGIDNGGTLTLNNSTISGNSIYAWNGGGINNNYGRATINNSTIVGNSAFDNSGFGGLGGGIFNLTGTLEVRNTIIASNTAATAPDLYGNLGSLGHNLIANTQGGSGFDATDLLNVNSVLGPLQDNGGPTKTMALLPGSPALNAGDPDQLGVADQRGVVRSGGVNIGAYQASASAFVVTVPGTVAAGTPFDVTVQAVDVFGQVAFGYTGTVTFSVTDTDPAVVLPLDYTFTAGDQGRHTFSGELTLITPGDQTLTVADLANGLSKDVTVTVDP